MSGPGRNPTLTAPISCPLMGCKSSCRPTYMTEIKCPGWLVPASLLIDINILVVKNGTDLARTLPSTPSWRCPLEYSDHCCTGFTCYYVLYGTKSQIYSNAFAITGWRCRKPVGDHGLFMLTLISIGTVSIVIWRFDLSY